MRRSSALSPLSNGILIPVSATAAAASRGAVVTWVSVVPIPVIVNSSPPVAAFAWSTYMLVASVCIN